MMKKIFYIGLSIIICGAVCIACKKESSCKNCKYNKPPIANAGPDQAIALPTDTILLEGSASNDPDGTIQTWLWTKISGPTIFSIINSTTARPVLKNLAAGTYHVELRVTDNGGLWAKDTVMITVNATQTNQPPIANAGADQTITLPLNEANIDGSGSTDPDNNITTYVWEKISGPLSFTIIHASAAQTRVADLTEGVYLFELKVTDAKGAASKDTVRVSVEPAGTPAIIFANMTLTNQCYDPRPGVCWINGDGPSYGFYIRDTANILPHSANAILGVWVKMDTSNVWNLTPAICWAFPDPYPQTDFTYCRTSDGLWIYSWFYPFEDMAGRKADVKIQF
jgi:hypothetical protein